MLIRSLHELVASHSLRRVIPGLVDHLAGATRFRYCPDCMRAGFQAATCQIDGVVNCLIHDRPLLCNCQHCGAETPGYAVGKAVRLCCAHCDWSWCGLRVGEPSQSLWGNPDRVGRFEALHRWLARLNTPEIVDWRNLDAWNVGLNGRYGLQGDHYRQRRLAVFDALSVVVLGAPVFDVRSNVSVLGPYAHDGTYCGRQTGDWRPDEKIPGQLGMLPTEDERPFYGHFTLFSGDAGVPVPTHPIVPPEVHAKILWRAQIYGGGSPLRDEVGLRHLGTPPLRLEAWSLGRVLGLKDTRSWELNCDHTLRVEVLRACALAARRVANRWHEVLRRKGRCSPNELIEDFQAHQRELGVWSQWDHFPIAFISTGARPLREGDRGSSERVYLAVI